MLVLVGSPASLTAQGGAPPTRCDSVAARYAADTALPRVIPPDQDAVMIVPQFDELRRLPRRVSVHYTITASGLVDTASVTIEEKHNKKQRRLVQEVLRRTTLGTARAEGCSVSRRTSLQWARSR